MKKYLIYSICLISAIFIGINNIKASTLYTATEDTPKLSGTLDSSVIDLIYTKLNLNKSEWDIIINHEYTHETSNSYWKNSSIYIYVYNKNDKLNGNVNYFIQNDDDFIFNNLSVSQGIYYKVFSSGSSISNYNNLPLYNLNNLYEDINNASWTLNTTQKAYGNINNEKFTYKTLYDSTISSEHISISENTDKRILDINNNILKKTLNIDYGNIDNTKYLYMFSIDMGSNWTTYVGSENIKELEVYSNRTIIAKIVDINDTSNSLATATFTVSEIYSPTMTINITKKANDTCKTIYNNQEIESCNDLDISFSNYNFNIYNYQYKTTSQNEWNNINESDFNNGIYNYILSDNAIIVRTLTKDNQEIVSKSYSGTFTGILENIGEPFVDFKIYYNFDMCSKPDAVVICDNYKMIPLSAYNDINRDNVDLENVFSTIGIQIFNYSNNYKYRYFDMFNTEEKEITTLQDSNFNYKYTAIETSINMTFFVNIYDLNDNLISSKSITISGIPEEKENINNLFDYFNDFDISGFTNTLQSIWNFLKNSPLISYIMILVIGTIIIVVIKAANRS